MKFTTSDPAGMAIAERIVSCVSIAFDDLHDRTADRWKALAPARPHLMNAVVLDELRQEFADDPTVITQMNDQLQTFNVKDMSLTFRVKKQRDGKLKVAINDTLRDQVWGLSLSQLPLPLPVFADHELLVLSYAVSRDWQLLESVTFMEFQNSVCTALERLPLELDEPVSTSEDGLAATRKKPSVYRVRPDLVERIELPGLFIEEDDEMGS